MLSSNEITYLAEMQNSLSTYACAAKTLGRHHTSAARPDTVGIINAAAATGTFLQSIASHCRNSPGLWPKGVWDPKLRWYF